MKTKKAFTLIELLIVIAIIGILAGVILVSTGSARNKAKDAAIISSTNSLMKAAQVDSVASGNYSNWYAAAIPTTPEECEGLFNQTSQPAAVEAACKSIITNQGSNGPPVGNSIFWGSWGGSTPRLSIMAWLPGEQKYYCIGSNGASSKAVNGPQCGGVGFWNCPGCAGDTSANGN